MNSEPAEVSLRRPPLLTILVVLAVAAGLALANLSTEPVNGELIKRITSKPERAYGWPITWYWRVASIVPGTVRPWNSSSTRSVLEWPIARYSPGGLAANVSIWLLLVTGCATACQRLLRKYQPHIHWRPRLSTLMVLLAVAAPTVLANMTFETSKLSPISTIPPLGATARASFGWPLIWNWYIVAPFDNIYSWDFNAGRLAGNIAIWLAMLAAVGIPCEWLLRRYRLRLRFSLRTMLAGTAVIAILCAWGTSIWKRARDQDALVGFAISDNSVSVERWGPKWLALVVPDRFRRRVVGASLDIGRWPDERDEEQSNQGSEEMQNVVDSNGDTNDDTWDTDDETSAEDQVQQDEDLLRRLARLPALRFIEIDCGVLTPAMSDALADMRQLRMVSVYIKFPASPDGRANLAWLANLRQLDQVSLEGVKSDDLSCLASLKRLKSLRLDIGDCEDDEAEMDKRLAPIGKLRQLRRLRLEGFPGGRIVHLAGLSNLKSLVLDFPLIYNDRERIREFFVALGRLTQLEQLQIGLRDDLQIYPDDLACLRGLKNLQSLRLHIFCNGSERQECLLAIASLTQLRRLWLEGDLVSADLAALLPLESLEELTSDHRMATPAALESLAALKRLKAIRIAGLDIDLHSQAQEAGEVRRALEVLRRSHPGIVIHADYNERWLEAQREDFPSSGCEPFNAKPTDIESFLGMVPFLGA